jgi:hypothetical protein
MYMNEGEGDLQKVTKGAFVTDGGNSLDLEVADIDGDGDLDVLVANTGQNSMYINQGGGDLQKVTEGAFVSESSPSDGPIRGTYLYPSLSDPPMDLEIVDIDSDGDLDVFVANGRQNNDLYVNQGGGDLQKVTDSAFVTDVGDSRDLEVADIDGDGDLDVLVATYGQNNNMYAWVSCPAGAARLSSRASWCFDCPTFAMQIEGGAPVPLKSLAC